LFQVLLLVFKCVHCSYWVPSVYIDRFVIDSVMGDKPFLWSKPKFDPP